MKTCLLNVPVCNQLCICVASCSSIICCDSCRRGTWELGTIFSSLCHCLPLWILAASTTYKKYHQERILYLTTFSLSLFIHWDITELKTSHKPIEYNNHTSSQFNYYCKLISSPISFLTESTKHGPHQFE